MKKETNTKSLLDRWKSRDIEKTVIPAITKIPEGIDMPLSAGQKRLWFLQQMYPNNPFYNLSEYYVFNGTLNINTLKRSLKAIIDKHSILKSFYEIDENDSPVLKIANSNSVDIVEQDFSNYNESEAGLKAKNYMDKQAHFSFDLTSAPLIKSSILKLSPNKHILFLTYHHIIIDQWSMGLLKDELAYNYNRLLNGLDLVDNHNTIQYIDYAYWQNNHQDFSSQVAYWKNKLAGEIPVLNLPKDFKRPIKPSYKGKDHLQEFSKHTSLQILELSKQLEITPFILFLTAYYIVLHNYTKQEDLLIGTPISNRNQNNLEQVFGLFIDTVVLRTSVKKSFTILQFIKSVQQMFMEALSNKDVPFDVLVKALNVERSLATNPFFQTMFVYSSKSKLPVFGDDLELVENSEFNTNVSKFDISLFITEHNGMLSSSFEYATDLFEEQTINRFHQQLKNTIEFIVKNTNETIADIPVLTADDRTLLEQNNTLQTNAFENYQSIHSIIEDIAVKHPNNIALTFGDVSIEYNELNEKANKVAQELLKYTTKNKIVGLCIERSLDMIIGMLGILKAGCAYLPIDPEYPPQRIDFMLKDSKVDNIITQTSLLNLFDEFEVNAILMDSISHSKTTLDIALPITNETDLAYVIYTSGSTGQPKGVPITHKNIINSTGGRLNFYSKNPSAFLLMSSISFDSSKTGIFWTLCTGGNLVISEKRLEQDIEQIAHTIEKHNVTHTLMLPSLYQVILENVDTAKLKSLTTIMVAGEACSKSLCKNHFKTLPHASLYNEYGPTEASVWCIAHKIERIDLKKDNIPIGKPVANAQIYLLDNDKKLVPFGTSGEIYIGGQGLSKGYLNRPDLSHAAFIENPFNTNEKLYKTGDLAKYRNDGSIEFLGRRDQQIKIRGFRVELDEIENTITKSDLVNQAIVLVKQDEGKPKKLTVYIKPNALYDEQQLKQNLKHQLPDYMIPSSFITIDAIPYLPNGKVDKKSLEKIEETSKTHINSPIEKPINAIEQKLLNLWKSILNIESLSTTDNFFEIGGDSISSIQFIAKARKEGMMISPNQIFDHQTIKELATYISKNEKQQEEWDYLVALRKGGTKKPLFCIHAGGGHVYFYNNLKNHIDKDRPIYALQASGVYGNHRMHDSIEDMTKDYFTAMKSIQPEGPYNVLVYCFSVTVGHEMMIQLNKLNQKTNLIVMDTMADPWNLNTPERLKIRIKGFLKRSLDNPVSTAKHFISGRMLKTRQLFIKMFASSQEKGLVDLNKNLIKISENYKWEPSTGDIKLILTEKVEKSLNVEVIKSWEELLSGSIEVKEVKGDHILLFEEPNIKFIAKEINKSLM